MKRFNPINTYHDRFFFLNGNGYSIAFSVEEPRQLLLNRVEASESKRERVRLYCHRRIVRGSSLEKL